MGRSLRYVEAIVPRDRGDHSPAFFTFPPFVVPGLVLGRPLLVKKLKLGSFVIKKISESDSIGEILESLIKRKYFVSLEQRFPTTAFCTYGETYRFPDNGFVVWLWINKKQVPFWGKKLHDALWKAAEEVSGK